MFEARRGLGGRRKTIRSDPTVGSAGCRSYLNYKSQGSEFCRLAVSCRLPGAAWGRHSETGMENDWITAASDFLCRLLTRDSRHRLRDGWTLFGFGFVYWSSLVT